MEDEGEYSVVILYLFRGFGKILSPFTTGPFALLRISSRPTRHLGMIMEQLDRYSDIPVPAIPRSRCLRRWRVI